MDFFQNVALFKELTVQEILGLHEICHKRRYEKGEIIFLSGDASETFYIIIEGQISGYIDLQGNPSHVFIKKQYQSTGTGALLREPKRIFTTVCDSASCSLYAIPMVSLEKLYETHPFMHGKIMAVLAKMYHERTKKVVEIYKKELGFFELKHIF